MLGSELNIDADVLKILEKVDKRYSELIDKNNTFSKSAVEAFSRITKDGIDPFLNKLQQQRDAFQAILSIDMSSRPSAAMKNLAKEASKAVDDINKLLMALQGISTSKDTQRSNKTVASEINKETNEYFKSLDAQIKARQEYLIRQENVEKERVRIIRDATKQVEKEIQKENDAYLKGLEIKIKAAQEQQIRNEHIRSQRELIANKAKEHVEREVKEENDAYLKGLNDRIKQAQEYQLRNEKVASERKRIETEVTKHVENEIKKEKDAHLKSLSEQIKARQEYLERVRKLQESQAKRESEMRLKMFQRIQQYGDTSGQATSAYNRLYGEHGVKSVNNMNRALQRLQDAQNKLNLNTDKGRQKYDELGKKIQQIKKDLDKATQANEKFHNSHSKLLNTTDQLQRKLALLFSISAIQGYMDKLVNVRKEFELQQKSLQVLLRDKDQADKLWQQTIDLAVKSPFRVSQLVSYTKQLAAYRIESDKLYDTTKMLSDVSAGLGVDMQRIILAFGQVRTANYLRGTELRQFTEAGIPMLDELAQMFTELEGRAVKAGDVFERISKRMVTFRDVEEVFKRMTSSSGVFYNMQEEQSKTLFGMISNLHDSIDLMLNDIGRSNDGIIKDMVSLTRDLVENWRGVAIVLKQVGVTLAMIGLAKFVTGWRIASTAITTGSTSAALAMNGMAGSAARLRIAMSTLGKTISSHPWYLLIGAVASAGYSLWEYIEAIDAANAKYDDMSRREIAHIDQLEELKKKTEQYNAIIEDGNSSEQSRNKAQLENDKILSQIKAKYPELYPLIVQQENKTIDLTKAIERQNEVLGVNIALQQKAKGKFFQEDFSKNYKDALESQDALKSSLVSLQSEASQASVQLKKLLANGEIPKDVANDFDSLFKSIRNAKNFEEAKEYVYELSDAFKKIGNDANLRIPLFKLFDDVRSKFAELNREQINYTNSLSTWGANLERQMDAFRVGIEDAMVGLNADEANKKATQWVNQQLDALGVVDKELKKWAQQYIVRETGIKLTFVDEGKKVYTEADLTKEWQKKIWNAIKKVESTNPDIKLGVTLEDVATQDLSTLAKTLNESVETAIKENTNVIDVGKITEQVRFTPQQIKNAEDSVEPLKKLANIIGLIIKQTSGNKGKDWFSEVIKSVKDAHSEFVKLNKTLDKTESKQIALERFKDVFATAAKNAKLNNISLGQFTFETESGVVEAFSFLKDKLPKNAKEARFKIEEALSNIRGEIRINDKELNDKLILDKIESLFGNYEISLELEKLNITPDLAKNLFNLDAITLPELKTKVIDMSGQFVGTDMEDKYSDFLKKINEMEDKAQLERLKKYTQYLVKGQSERVKIKMEEIRQLSKLEELGFSEEQKKQIRKGIEDETKEKLSKAEWEAFKDTDIYIQMFEDLGIVSNKVLSDLKNKLINMRGSLSDLDPRSLKDITSQIEKINRLQTERNPFDNLKDSIKNGIDAIKRLNKEQEAYYNAQKEQDFTQGAIDSIMIANERKKAEIESAKAAMLSLDTTEEQSAMYNKIIQDNKQSIAQNNTLLKALQAQLIVQEKATETAARRLGITKEEVVAFNNSANQIGGWGSAATNAITEVTNMLTNWGVEMSYVASGILDGFGQMFSSLEQLDITKPFSILKSATGILAGFGNIFASIFGFGNHDRRAEKKIQSYTKYVEQLEKAYERLEKQINDAYSIDSLQKSGKDALNNITAQIESYEKMIEAENSKKKTDDDRVKEWKNEIEALENLKAEKEKELVSTATDGILDDVRSAAREFVDAWVDAFNETGDGLIGLKDNFKQNMLEMVKQQAAMLISQSYIERWKKQLEQYINPEDLELTTDEAGKWVNAVSESLPQLNEALEKYFTAMQQAGVDVSGGTSGELSGLAKGISGITESQADILAAYANSCRFFLANIDTTLTSVANQILGGENMPNPILSELRTQTELVRGISTLLNSVVRGSHSMGGQGIKVFIS